MSSNHLVIVFGAVAWPVLGLFARAICLGDFWKFREVAEAPSFMANTLVMLGPIGLAIALFAADRPYRLRWHEWKDEHWSPTYRRIRRMRELGLL